MSDDQTFTSQPSRRAFIKSSALAAAGLSVGLPSASNFAYAAGSDTLRVGLVGCGGRGTGAANDCVRSSPGVELWAMGDLFEDRLDQSKKLLQDAVGADSFKVTPDRSFVGFDAYRRVLDSGVDVVLLATPPGFRPEHLRAAVEAGTHAFLEKPVAVDSAGVRSVMASADRAAEKDLAIVVGTQRRHHPGYAETMRRIHDGAIGKVVAAQTFYNAGGFRNAWEREPGMSDMEWQIRNWYYFTWLSGDHIVEQAVHRIDLQNWALQAHPVRATAVGGRQARVDPSFGHIYDHFGVEYEYPSGARVSHQCRQMKNTRRRVGEHFIGTTGTADTSDRVLRIDGATEWRYDEKAPNPYVQEHADLIASIRADEPLNEGRRAAESMMTAIMGREAAYTGEEITWDEIMQADHDLMPEVSEFGPVPTPPVAMPGKTKLSRSVLAASEEGSQ